MFRPRVLAIDDAPFDKGQSTPVPLIAVTMEAADVVESIAIRSFPVDGSGATEYLADWVGQLRPRPSLQALLVGGITIAGLGLIDLPLLADRLGIPVLAVTRHNPDNKRLKDALQTAGLGERIPIVDRSPKAYRVAEGLFLAHAGGNRINAEELVLATIGKSRLPEPLRLAHLVGQALVLGESRGRV